ncbi:toll/interleukin-1 receptor domain-containing protein [Leptolyngbya sp. FACHB-261]|uniref:toll/interleukin-1 receptor domain-containing protein n=1 Tax=Leptolyngbya sp. FACHB-261 TaxID=2692806 RepID=UPI0016826F12|nr:toll/interleukin-1 receptor domain-containing protein [Leptolyngbya sp. FACHB-261]MBD2104460.1 toll/interleukin-1 receptor domain-containing protein [Leptolyngbya sp. FACHB-261]
MASGGTDQANGALGTWQRKLAFLEQKLAGTSNASQQFELQEQINECNQQIQRLQASTASAPPPGAASRPSAQTVAQASSEGPVEVFISYSHKDDELREELVVHLSNLKRQGKIKAWHDRALEAGNEWDAEIKAQLEAARIILLLITPRFMASEYINDIELARAMERHAEGSARVIPIILKPTDFKGSPFSKLQALPRDAKPITTWANQDEAFLNVVEGIRRVAENLRQNPR